MIVGRASRVSAIPDRARPALAPRQLEALRHRALGLTVAATAAEMGVTEKSLKTSMNDAYRRLGANCLEDALRAVGWLVVPVQVPRS